MNGPADTVIAVLREHAALIALVVVIWIIAAAGLFYFWRAVIRSAVRARKDEGTVHTRGRRQSRSE